MKYGSTLRGKGGRLFYDGPFAKTPQSGAKNTTTAPRVRAWSSDAGFENTPRDWNNFRARPIGRPATPTRRD